MELKDLKKQNAYRMSAWASNIFPDMDGAVFAGDVDYRVASGFEAVAQKHAAALASLPAGTTRDPTQLTYLIFFINDKMKVVAWEWINPGTIQETVTNVRNVQVVGATPADDARIRSLLASGGFLVSTIS